eukprot:12926764-Prorocentrum_lima.AAC.1
MATTSCVGWTISSPHSITAADLRPSDLALTMAACARRAVIDSRFPSSGDRTGGSLRLAA